MYYIQNQTKNLKLNLGTQSIFFEIIQNVEFDSHHILKSSEFFLEFLGKQPVQVNFVVSYRSEDAEKPLMEMIKEVEDFYRYQFGNTEHNILNITPVSKFKGYLTNFRTKDAVFSKEGILTHIKVDFGFTGHYEDEFEDAVAKAATQTKIEKVLFELGVVNIDEDGKQTKINSDYKLSVDGQGFEEALSGGSLSQEVNAKAQGGLLEIFENGKDKAATLSYQLFFSDEFPEADSVEGAQYRLSNLDFNCGDPDGELGPTTEQAIKKFQRFHEFKEITGKLDSDTINKIKSEHGH